MIDRVLQISGSCPEMSINICGPVNLSGDE